MAFEAVRKYYALSRRAASCIKVLPEVADAISSGRAGKLYVGVVGWLLYSTF